MKMRIHTGRLLILLFLFSFTNKIFAQKPLSNTFIYRGGMEFRPGYVVPTHSSLKGDGYDIKPVDASFSSHLKYSLQFRPDTDAGRVYGAAYQGIGLASYTFFEPGRFGNPLAVYLFQGGRIAPLSSRLSFNYEWNFGVSWGWHPFDYTENYYNQIIGSKVNAYINTNFYLSWMLSGGFELTSGITLTHFSNGNTKIPNGGLNTVGLKVGMIYHFPGKEDLSLKPVYRFAIPEFPRHVSYDLVLFGSWRRKGVTWDDREVLSPEAYPVMGISFAPMYNLSYKIRAGIGLDGVYDKSANVCMDYYYEFERPPFHKQLSLGLSARMEYVMPYFTVGVGFGANVLHGGGDLRAFYQLLALKIELTRNSFLHVGYSIHNFHEPNFLMLGVGFRFNNKYPFLYRR